MSEPIDEGGKIEFPAAEGTWGTITYVWFRSQVSLTAGGVLGNAPRRAVRMREIENAQARRNVRKALRATLLAQIGFGNEVWAGLLFVDSWQRRIDYSIGPWAQGLAFTTALEEGLLDGAELIKSGSLVEMSKSRWPSYSRALVRTGGSELAEVACFACEDERGWPAPCALGFWAEEVGGDPIVTLPLNAEDPWAEQGDKIRIHIKIGT